MQRQTPTTNRNPGQYCSASSERLSNPQNSALLTELAVTHISPVSSDQICAEQDELDEIAGTRAAR